jgi:hypothetical protein
MSEELLPCPFCGGEAYLEHGFNYDYDGGDRWYVYSADVVCSCGCTLHVDNAWPKEYVSEEHSMDFAIAAWNNRATPTAKRVTVTMDERGTIGHTECSECGVLVGMDDRYCRHCGKEFT